MNLVSNGTIEKAETILGKKQTEFIHSRHPITHQTPLCWFLSIPYDTMGYDRKLNYVKTIKYLLKAGADPNEECITRASKRIRTIETRTASVEYEGQSLTPLMLAVIFAPPFKLEQVIGLLLKAGARRNTTLEYYNTRKKRTEYITACDMIKNNLIYRNRSFFLFQPMIDSASSLIATNQGVGFGRYSG
jgi:hypothetical protein